MSLSKVALSFTATLAALFTAASPEVFALKPEHTRTTFDVVRLGFLHTHGIFSSAMGELALDRQAKLGRIDVVINTASLSTDSANQDDYLKGKEFFNVAEFPHATVSAKDFNLEGQFPMAVAGTLTMLGVSKPIMLTITAMHCTWESLEHKSQCTGSVDTTIQRSDWGMSRYLLFVSNNVNIHVDVEATAN